MLTTAQKAPILDQNGNPLAVADHYSSSSSIGVASVEDIDGTAYVVAQSPGTATITVRRYSDNAEASLEVTVEEAPFSISLGAPESK